MVSSCITCNVIAVHNVMSMDYESKHVEAQQLPHSATLRTNRFAQTDSWLAYINAQPHSSLLNILPQSVPLASSIYFEVDLSLKTTETHKSSSLSEHRLYFARYISLN